MGALGHPHGRRAGWSGALRWPLSASCPPASPRAAIRAVAAHPPLPQGSLLQDTGGHCSGGRPGQQSALWLVSGDAIGGPGVGGEGTAGPGGEPGPKDGGAARESRSLAGRHRAHTLWAGNLGHPASGWQAAWTVHLGTRVGHPQRAGDPSSCDVGLTLFLPQGP